MPPPAVSITNRTRHFHPLLGVSVWFTTVSRYYASFGLRFRSHIYPCHILSGGPFSGGVGRCRLAAFQRQVCTTLSGNRTYPSRSIRLCHCSICINSLIVNQVVAPFAYHQCFPTFCQHCDFPLLFPFQVFQLIYMVNLVMLTLRRAAQLTYLGL